MDLKVIINNILYDPNEIGSIEKQENEVEITHNTTLQDIVGLADLSFYYPLSGVYSFNNQYVPYIVCRDSVLWNVSYNDAKVEDFVSTHDIRNHIILADGGYCQAGGPGFKELADIWGIIYPILDQFVTVIGATTIISQAGKWVASLFQEKGIPPQSYFDLIFSRQAWNHYELAKFLDITSNDSKKLLTAFGYRYNRSILMFEQQPESLILKKKLSNIQVLDI